MRDKRPFTQPRQGREGGEGERGVGWQPQALPTHKAGQEGGNVCLEGAKLGGGSPCGCRAGLVVSENGLMIVQVTLDL